MYYLSSFRPLNINGRGRKAIESYGLPPFIDCSCRREPDFESKYPSISAICHAGKFAPRLREDDSIVFITVKGKYPPFDFGHWRLVAILKVIKRFESHKEASSWYSSKSLPLPSNCMVEGNKPLPLEITAGPAPYSKYKKIQDPVRILNVWNKQYLDRVNKFGTFLVCTPEFLELIQPPIMTEDKMTEIFGRIPGTRNPPQISKSQFEKMQEVVIGKSQ